MRFHTLWSRCICCHRNTSLIGDIKFIMISTYHIAWEMSIFRYFQDSISNKPYPKTIQDIYDFNRKNLERLTMTLRRQYTISVKHWLPMWVCIKHLLSLPTKHAMICVCTIEWCKHWQCMMRSRGKQSTLFSVSWQI